MSRDAKRAFDNDASTKIKTASGHKVRARKVLSEDGKGSTDSPKTGKRRSGSRRVSRLRSRSSRRACRDRAHKRLVRIHERIGRLKAQSRGIGKYYEIEVIADAKKGKAVDVRWKRKQKEGSMKALRA